MAKFANDIVMDYGLNDIKAGVNRVFIGTAAGTTYAEAVTAAVGTLAVTTTNFTIANGDSSGRKITLAAATITVGTTGTISHIFLAGTTGSGTLWLAGTCAPTSVTVSGTVILAAWDADEIADIA